jgi:hypothetical protein
VPHSIGYLERVTGRKAVSRIQGFKLDDENDTRLFDKLQEYVLEHYPNPQRIGCLDHDTLFTFVEAPGKLDLADPKYLHIFKCAECTRELMELRCIRAGLLQQTSTSSPNTPARHRGFFHNWKWRIAAITASVFAVTIPFAVKWKIHSSQTSGNANAEDAVAETIDLGGVSLASPEEASHEHPGSLPRRLVNLRLVLPWGAPSGIYRVTVAKEMSTGSVLAEGFAYTVVQSAKTELHVKLNLRHGGTGSYFLGAVCEGGRASYFYPLVLD